MIYQVNAMTDDDDVSVREIGHLIYSREGNGLTEEELSQLTALIYDYIHDEGRLTERDKDTFDFAYQSGHHDGYSKGRKDFEGKELSPKIDALAEAFKNLTVSKKS